MERLGANNNNKERLGANKNIEFTVSRALVDHTMYMEIVYMFFPDASCDCNNSGSS